MKRVLSGIRPTGRLHLGNYLGAVKGMLELQNSPDYECFFMVVDVHALTTPYNIQELKVDRSEVVIDYLSAGLDPKKSPIFIQSMVPEHMELAFYVASVLTVARMQHLPTFKDKVKQHPDHATLALLNYPALMAADILMYKASAVPVGIDQEPHIEVAREVARKMNAVYGTDFPEPARFETEGGYIPSLLGEGKMSKSIEGSFITLRDDLDTIKDRLAKVPTDSGKGLEIPSQGSISNLLTFVEVFMGSSARKECETAYLGEGLRYKDLKEELAKAIFEQIKPIQEKRKELEANPEYVDCVISEGGKRAQKVAKQTIAEVKEKMGLG